MKYKGKGSLTPTIKTVLFAHSTIDAGKRPNVQNHVRYGEKKNQKEAICGRNANIHLIYSKLLFRV